MTLKRVKMAVTVAIGCGSIGCGALHSTRTEFGEADGTVPSTGSKIGDSSYIGPAPTYIVDMDQVSTLGPTPGIVVDGGVLYSGGDFSAEDIKLSSDSFYARKLISKPSVPVTALALLHEQLAKWVQELADAQQARDEARAKASAEAIGQITQMLVKLLVVP